MRQARILAFLLISCSRAPRKVRDAPHQRLFRYDGAERHSQTSTIIFKEVLKTPDNYKYVLSRFKHSYNGREVNKWM